LALLSDLLGVHHPDLNEENEGLGLELGVSRVVQFSECLLNDLIQNRTHFLGGQESRDFHLIYFNF
jgi:hypothetical protein